jgi:hypothetical protein
LHLIAAPETDVRRAAEKVARDALGEATRRASEGKLAVAAQRMSESLPQVLSTNGLDHPGLNEARASLAV